MPGGDLRSCAFHRSVWPWWGWFEHVVWEDPVRRRYYCINCGLGEPLILQVIDQWDEQPDFI